MKRGSVTFTLDMSKLRQTWSMGQRFVSKHYRDWRGSDGTKLLPPMVAGATIGGLYLGYKLGKENPTKDHKLAVGYGLVVGAIGGGLVGVFWPLAIPMYGIYKVVEVASRQ